MTLFDEFKKYICQTSDSPLGLEIAGAQGPYLISRSGEKYLDLIAGIGVANIGHGRPEVLTAITRQAEAFLHPMVYGEVVQEIQVRYARKLAEVLPGEIDNIFFANSGAEAIEGAMKTARKFTGRQEILSFDHCYHGDTFGALSLQAEPRYREPFEPVLPKVNYLPWNEIDGLSGITEQTAGVIIEPVQGEGGIRIPSVEFMQALQQQCREKGALLIADEVMTGFGRTGKLFAVEHFKVEPDIIVLAKALGGGMPMGAFAGSRKLMRTLSENPPLAHVTTFGGHPVCCAAGMASLEIILQENLSDRANKIGNRFIEGLGRILNKSTKITGVHGLGCFIGVVFKNEKMTRDFVEACLDGKIIVGWTLHHSNILRMAPPLILSDSEIDFALKKMTKILT